MTATYPARLTIDLDAIRDNTAELVARAGGAGVMSVVKADGYGHGLLESARATLAGGASWLGTAQVSEAMTLREHGVQAPILAWLHTPATDFGAAIAAGIDLGVSSRTSLEAILAGARRAGIPARLHLKVDTGLGRNGVGPADLPALVDHAVAAQRAGTAQVVGIMTHLAYADAPGHPTVRAQQRAFDAAIALAERAGGALEVRHLANSAATLTAPDAGYDLVRPGLAIYGVSPVPGLGDESTYRLRPAMTLSADIALVKQVPAGTGVSYAHAYTTARATTLIDVPIGYSDGVPRAGTNVGPVWVGGRRFTVAGRVCMDQFMVDVGDLPAGEGDEVVLFGPGDRGEPTVRDWADACGTISYEILTRIGARVPRVYLGLDG